MTPKEDELVKVNARLWGRDVESIKRSAESKGIPWQIELRALVHRAAQEVSHSALLEISPRKK